MDYVILLDNQLICYEVYSSFEEALHEAKRVFFFYKCIDKAWHSVFSEEQTKNGCKCCGINVSKFIVASIDDTKTLAIQQLIRQHQKNVALPSPKETTSIVTTNASKKVQVFIKQATVRLICIELCATDTFQDFLLKVKNAGISHVSVLTYTFNGKRLHDVSTSLFEYIPENSVVTGNIQTLPPAYYDPQM